MRERFRIKEKLGQGGIGEIYLAEDLHERELVVVKVLKEDNSQDEQVRAWLEKHFFDEARALRLIDHPGVPKLIDVGKVDDGRYFFAMEFIEGSTLRSQIAPNSGLIGGFERVANVMRQLGQILTVAHEKGIYHRDLKPENIMLQKPKSFLDDKERVRVIDFGIATVKDSPNEETKTTQLPAGTILYMAPEQILNKPSVASDVYAMGVIAYELVTGRPPFVPEAKMLAMVELYEMQRGGVTVLPKQLRRSLPEGAQELILQALSFDPAARPKSAKEFGEAFADSLLQVESSVVSLENRLESSIETLKMEGRKDKSTLATLRHQQETKVSLSIATKVMAVASVVLLSALMIVLMNKKDDSIKGTSQPKEVTLRYWGLLQQYRNRKPAGEPIKLTGGIAGETYFNSGDGLKFFATASSAGYLYIVNESENANRQTVYTILFPSLYSKSSEIFANEEVATSECIFDENLGTERVWILWSDKRIDVLETAYRKWGNMTDGGEVKDAAYAGQIRSLLDNLSKDKPRVEFDAESDSVKVISNKSVIGHLLKLKHKG
ncbi:MAG: protein kinase [Acidobacteriota bacterium]|nr:protein kinase [Acidobacteriota bacterium]